ncbi:probable leucine-rich repeat receptor-like serine/threonine-protein kinase At3g14840 [Arachis duranensis]|uniref:non-specific serine/threonine protein kinase n=1 Tax=Arachis duranensis TaxID=130453 RepID=A0A6P4BY94_ARADU|nr:probable leucine-rich repeat receptor-like serine/threonine-protein kinase At3g14840 [Arachis duranensis]
MKKTSPYISFFLLLFFVFSAFCFSSLAFGQATLPQDEVEALNDIAKTLGKEDLFSEEKDVCISSSEEEQSGSSCMMLKGNQTTVVICNCSYADSTLCHVTSLCVKRESLPGQLPAELVRLPYLQQIDLTYNLLNGTIPKEWGRMTNLTFISLGGNRITGSIPKEIANISTLQVFVVEFNQMSGELPPELGNLSQLQRLQINSNNFTGELPATLAKLTSLQTVQLADNQFSGKIPDFIQSWTNLQQLVIQGSGLSGPIPSGISVLEHLNDLRISDLNGDENSSFPQLKNMSMKNLILRSCNINGTLPIYLGNMTSLQTLDLSFNKLTGPIPSQYESLITRLVAYMYLTGNFLTGDVPKEWINNANKKHYLDLSYNNFSISGSQDKQGCQDENTNLFASSLTRNDTGKVSCLESSVCSKTSYSFRINCGGEKVTINGKTYDDDTDEGGAAKFYDNENTYWAFSSTGNYLESKTPNYIPSIDSSMLSLNNNNDAELYTNARASPVSLTYYGFCLGNGNYIVDLHFAEIVFTHDQTYKSLGRRIFDIYIQGNLVRKDFNIAEEAGGIGKNVIKSFNASVINGTLEIRLYWAGKGTTAIPQKSIYGPLISAISVYRDHRSGISTAAVVGIVVAVAIIIILLIFGMLWWKGCLGKRNSKELNGIKLETGMFSIRQIKMATNNFDIINKIGEGGFGPVYKGKLSNGTIVAVKQLSSKSKQGNREFLNEIGMISALQHPCLVKLYGCCVEGDQLFLIYEYMQNNSLARALFGREEHQIKLDWQTRHKICVGIARGLAYLHEESRVKVVHRDIKATNILLDEYLNPKISDFGLAKLDEEDNTHISTRIAGTYGYMAPEYAMHGQLTDKADVYSFGIVALEIVSGRNNTTNQHNEGAFVLLDWARLLREKGDIMEIVDRRLLDSNLKKEEVMVMINVAFLCTNVSPTLRPTMSSVVSMLEGKTVVPKLASESLDEKKLEALQMYYHQDHQSTSTMEVPLTTSSTSTAQDLYSIHLDSSYFESRN